MQGAAAWLRIRTFASWDKGSSLRRQWRKRQRAAAARKEVRGEVGTGSVMGLLNDNYKRSYLRSAMGLRTVSYHLDMPSTYHGD